MGAPGRARRGRSRKGRARRPDCSDERPRHLGTGASIVSSVHFFVAHRQGLFDAPNTVLWTLGLHQSLIRGEYKQVDDPVAL